MSTNSKRACVVESDVLHGLAVELHSDVAEIAGVRRNPAGTRCGATLPSHQRLLDTALTATNTVKHYMMNGRVRRLERRG